MNRSERSEDGMEAEARWDKKKKFLGGDWAPGQEAPKYGRHDFFLYQMGHWDHLKKIYVPVPNLCRKRVHGSR